jgi:hypothetical protein
MANTERLYKLVEKTYPHYGKVWRCHHMTQSIADQANAGMSVMQWELCGKLENDEVLQAMKDRVDARVLELLDSEF